MKTKIETSRPANKLMLPLIVAATCGLMYMMAFHNARDEKEDLQHENDKLELEIEKLKIQLEK